MEQSAFGTERGPSPIKALNNYHFAGFHASHIGALYSAMNYYGIGTSPSRVFGLTGHAFLSAADSGMRNPLVGLPEEFFYTLAQNIGLRIDGVSEIADGSRLPAMQAEAWTHIRSALDDGRPAFAKELDLGNETSIIYAYGRNGYYTHSWHGGDGHEGANREIPWTMLGQNYCPCAPCRERNSPLKPSTDLYLGSHADGAFVSYHWAIAGEKAETRHALKEALRFALEFNGRKRYAWGKGTFHTGPDMYEAWLESVRMAAIFGFYMGYFVDIWLESRYHAVHFLREMKEELSDCVRELDDALATYTAIRDLYQRLTERFPWMQPREPIADPFRRKDAIALLTELRELEKMAMDKLDRLFRKL